MFTAFSDITAEQLNSGSEGFLPGYLGINILEVGDGFLEAELAIKKN